MEQGAAGVLGEVVSAAQAAVTARRAADHQLREAVARLERDGSAAAAGYRSTAALLGDALRVNQVEAKRLVRRAAQLVGEVSLSGQQREPGYPATAAAARGGVVDEGHIAVVAETMDRLERVPGLDADTLAAAEATLAEHAATLSPAGLRKVALRLVATLDPDGAAPEEDGEPVDEAHLVRRRDGSIALKLRIHDAADAEVVVEVFDALGAPAGPDDVRTRAQRDAEVFKELCGQAVSPTGIATDARAHERHHDDREQDASSTGQDADGMNSSATNSNSAADGADCGADRDAADRDAADRGEGADRGATARRNEADGDETGGDEAGRDRSDHIDADHIDADHIGADHISGDAERSGAGSASSMGRGAGPSSGRQGAACGRVSVAGRALLAVTIDHRWLRRRLGHGLLDSQYAVSPATARRLACDAGIVPTVLGARSEALDVGRLSYTVPEAIRRALHHRDGGCSFPGCIRRPRRCHAHHVDHWIDGGETRLENLTLLCVTHHRLVHHSDWIVKIVDGRPWWWPPTWIDPDR